MGISVYSTLIVCGSYEEEKNQEVLLKYNKRREKNMINYINIRKEIEICCHGCKYNAQQYVFVPQIKKKSEAEEEKTKKKKLKKIAKSWKGKDGYDAKVFMEFIWTPIVKEWWYFNENFCDVDLV